MNEHPILEPAPKRKDTEPEAFNKCTNPPHFPPHCGCPAE